MGYMLIFVDFENRPPRKRSYHFAPNTGHLQYSSVAPNDRLSGSILIPVTLAATCEHGRKIDKKGHILWDISCFGRFSKCSSAKVLPPLSPNSAQLQCSIIQRNGPASASVLIPTILAAGYENGRRISMQ